MTAAAAGMKGDDSLPPSSASPHIPFDLLVEEILYRLPVKYLLQLRYVCKSWNSLISHDSKFAKKQLHFSTFCHDRHHLAVSPYYTPQKFHIFDSPISSFFSSSSVASSSSITTSFTQLKHPSILNFEWEDLFERISTCHGIICFRMKASLALLFNPSIQKFNFLPPMKNSVYQNHFTLVYDRLSDNHKIIALSGLSCRLELNVHTLGTDYWRKIQDLPYYISHQIGIFVSGTVNWLVTGCTNPHFPRVILYFDLETELCQEFTYPLFDETLRTDVCLGALKDCLCIFFSNIQFSDIWIMKEYGNEKSWSKLLRIPYIGDPYIGDPGFFWPNKALYIYEDDQVLVKFVKKRKYSLAVYDSKKNTFKILEIQSNIHPCMTEVVYVESLMSP